MVSGAEGIEIKATIPEAQSDKALARFNSPPTTTRIALSTSSIHRHWIC